MGPVLRDNKEYYIDPFSRFRLQNFRHYHNLIHTGCVNTAEWNKIGTFAITGSDDRHVKIWDINSFYSDCTVTQIHDVHTSHSGNIFNAKFFVNDDDKIVSSAADGIVSTYSLCSRHSEERIFESNDMIHAVEFDIGDPHVLYVAEEFGYVTRIDLRVKVPEIIFRNQTLNGNSCSVKSIAQNSIWGSNILVIGGSGFKIGSIDLRGCSTVLYSREVDASFSNILSPDNFLQIWSPLDSHYSSSHRNLIKKALWNEDEVSVSRLLFNADGSRLLVNYQGDQIYSFSTPICSNGEDSLKNIYGGHLNHDTFLKSVSFFGPEEQYIVCGSDNGYIYVYDSNSGSLTSENQCRDCNIAAVYHADSKICNGVTPHPFLPLFISYGIDSEAKMWKYDEEIPTFNKSFNLKKIYNFQRSCCVPLIPVVDDREYHLVEQDCPYPNCRIKGSVVGFLNEELEVVKYKTLRKIFQQSRRSETQTIFDAVSYVCSCNGVQRCLTRKSDASMMRSEIPFFPSSLLSLLVEIPTRRKAVGNACVIHAKKHDASFSFDGFCEQFVDYVFGSDDNALSSVNIDPIVIENFLRRKISDLREELQKYSYAYLLTNEGFFAFLTFFFLGIEYKQKGNESFKMKDFECSFQLYHQSSWYSMFSLTFLLPKANVNEFLLSEMREFYDNISSKEFFQGWSPQLSLVLMNEYSAAEVAHNHSTESPVDEVNCFDHDEVTMETLNCYMDCMVHLRNTLLSSWGNMSAAALQCRQYQITEIICSKALLYCQSEKLAPDAKLFYRRGTARYNNKDYDHALEDFQEAHRLVPNDANIIKMLKSTRAELEIMRKREAKIRSYLKDKFIMCMFNCNLFMSYFSRSRHANLLNYLPNLRSTSTQETITIIIIIIKG